MGHYKHKPHLFIRPTVGGPSSSFYLLSIVNSSIVDTGVEASAWTSAFKFFGSIPRIEFAGSMIWLSLFRAIKQSLPQSYHFRCLSSTCEYFSFSISAPELILCFYSFCKMTRLTEGKLFAVVLMFASWLSAMLSILSYCPLIHRLCRDGYCSPLPIFEVGLVFIFWVVIPHNYMICKYFVIFCELLFDSVDALFVNV